MEEDFGFQLNIQSSCSPSPIHCSTCAFMYNFTPTDVGVFLVIMCKINYLVLVWIHVCVLRFGSFFFFFFHAFWQNAVTVHVLFNEQ